MDWTNILAGALENLLNLVPFDIVHSYQQGVKFSGGQDVALLKHNNGMRKWVVVGHKIGIHWHWPIVESIEVESTAMRYVDTPYQDLTTVDDRSITVSASIGYSISNARRYWTALQDHADSIVNMAKGVIASEIGDNTREEISTETKRRDLSGRSELENRILSSMRSEAETYGVKVRSFSFTDFTTVRTYRIIGNSGMSGDDED
jgi:regulator of protease activity HflC (stomatin/prohibitin superfamily)